jgi:hypothetical protein
MTRRAEDATKALNEAFATPELAKRIDMMGGSLRLAMERFAGARATAPMADPIRMQIEGAENELRALDQRSIAARSAQARAAKEMELRGKPYSDGEREQAIALAGRIAAGGQTAIDRVEQQRIGVFGTLPSVDELAEAATPAETHRKPLKLFKPGETSGLNDHGLEEHHDVSHEDPATVVWSIRKIIEMQRHMNLPPEIGGIGGFAQIATVSAIGIEQRIIQRWPEDRVGAQLRPAPINWAEWHASNPRSSSGLVSPETRRLQVVR